MLLAIESVRKYKEIFLETNEKISTTKMEGILRDETHSYIDLYHIKKNEDSSKNLTSYLQKPKKEK